MLGRGIDVEGSHKRTTARIRIHPTTRHKLERKQWLTLQASSCVRRVGIWQLRSYGLLRCVPESWRRMQLKCCWRRSLSSAAGVSTVLGGTAGAAHSRRATEESFTLAVEQVSRVANDTQAYFDKLAKGGGREERLIDVLALEDALEIERREAAGISKLLLRMELIKLAWISRVRGTVLVAPRGSGKSEAVDRGLADAGIDLSGGAKQWVKRCTFAEFMDDSKATLLSLRNDSARPRRDPTPHYVRQLVGRTQLHKQDVGLRLLIVEDVQVASMVDAMLLRRLFTGLFGYGVGIILTTPRPPSMWYCYGVDHSKLTPFVDLIEKQCEIIRLDTRFKYSNPLL